MIFLNFVVFYIIYKVQNEMLHRSFRMNIYISPIVVKNKNCVASLHNNKNVVLSQFRLNSFYTDSMSKELLQKHF